MATPAHKPVVTRIKRKPSRSNRISHHIQQTVPSLVHPPNRIPSFVVNNGQLHNSAQFTQPDPSIFNQNRTSKLPSTAIQTGSLTNDQFINYSAYSLTSRNQMPVFGSGSAGTIKTNDFDLSVFNTSSKFEKTSHNSSLPLFPIGALGEKNDNEDKKNKRRRRGGFIMSYRCCFILLGCILCAILLAAVIASVVLLTQQAAKSKTTATTTTTTTATTSTTTTTTTSTTTTTTTSTTTTTRTTTSTTTTTTSSTTTSTTTTCMTPCTSYTWNQTGIVVADTAANPLSSPKCILLHGNNTMYLSDHTVGYVDKWVINSASRTAATSNNVTHVDYLCFDDSGALYTTNHLTNTVERFPAGSLVGSIVAGSPVTGSLNGPRGTAVDSNYTLYINDQGSKQILKVVQNGSTLVTAINTNGVINTPSAILLKSSSSNEMYISDEGGTAVYLWTIGAAAPTLNLTTVECSGTLNNPRGIKLDTSGNLYVADDGNKQIVMYCTNSTVGNIILKLSSGPVDFDIDSNLNLYVLCGDGKVYKHQLV